MDCGHCLDKMPAAPEPELDEEDHAEAKESRLTDVGKNPLLWWMQMHRTKAYLERVGLGQPRTGFINKGFELWQEPWTSRWFKAD